VSPPGEYDNKSRSFRKSSQVSRKPGLPIISGTPQQAKGGKDSAVNPETDLEACT